MLHLCGDVIIETAKKKRNKMLMSWLFFFLFVWISFENVQAVR